MNSALYGHGGFFHRPEGPGGHFRTSAHTTTMFATAVLRLLDHVDRSLGHPRRLDVVDLGAGRGELLLAIRACTDDTELGSRLRLHAVELAAAPAHWTDEIAWSTDPPDDVTGLVIANEWLDNVPVDVVRAADDGPERVLVDPVDGSEVPGGPIGLLDAGWLARWWPLAGQPAGSRAEIGLARDRAWERAVATVDRGLALAIDYGHTRIERENGMLAHGTLTGYRDGRMVAPVPDGSCDVTAHVAIDACAHAGITAGARSTRILRQREALRALGLSGALPPVELASIDSAGYAYAILQANEAAELLDPDGLGGFWWLAQSVGVELPSPLAR